MKSDMTKKYFFDKLSKAEKEAQIIFDKRQFVFFWN